MQSNTAIIGVIFLGASVLTAAHGADLTNAAPAITVASYYFGQYHPNDPRILNINCWNEWTEGSYLEPDTVNGMKYLEAVRDVFGIRHGPTQSSKK